MNLDFSTVEQVFSFNVGQLQAMSVLQAFALAAGILVGFILLGALAAMAGRWVSHSIDRIFEWLLLMALGAALAFLLLGGHLRFQ